MHRVSIEAGDGRLNNNAVDGEDLLASQKLLDHTSGKGTVLLWSNFVQEKCTALKQMVNLSGFYFFLWLLNNFCILVYNSHYIF